MRGAGWAEHGVPAWGTAVQQRSRALCWLSPSPGFIAEPQPCAKPSLSLPPRCDARPRQVWPPLRASTAMEPALGHWLPPELFMLQLAPNTLVYEEKTPGTVRYPLHLPSFGRPRQAVVSGQGCTPPLATHTASSRQSPAVLARTHHAQTRGSGPVQTSRIMSEPAAARTKAPPQRTRTRKHSPPAPNGHRYTLNTQEQDAAGMFHIHT